MSLISIDSFTKEGVDNYIANTKIIETQYSINQIDKLLDGKIIGLLFFEPSTRTRCSFEVAIKKLGGETILVNELYSSSKKGESIEDTVKTMECYCDALVIRHPEKNIMNKIFQIANKPIINAGDGDGEHPTQALLDIYTIHKHFNTVEKLTYTFVGDLKYSRTIHSLIKLLSLYSNIRVYLISPEGLKLPDEYKDILHEKGIGYYERSNLDEDVLLITNILYMTRLQKERFSQEDYINNNFVLGKEKMVLANKNMIVLHPLPRNDEICSEMDDDPRCKYIEQMINGIYMRMCILQNLF
jgi:aspartate carbamoyltransferase